MSATVNASELAEILGVSTWTIYESVRRGDCPIPPIRVGRRLLWSRSRVEELLGIGLTK
jgi:excisionase family DNA binding protein